MSGVRVTCCININVLHVNRVTIEDLMFVINVFSDPTPESQNNKIAVGTAGLLLGLVFLVAGLIYYKKNTAGERQDQNNQTITRIKFFRPPVLSAEAKSE